MTSLFLSIFLLCASIALAEEKPINLKRNPITKIGGKLVLNSKQLQGISMKLLMLGRRDKPVASEQLLGGIDRLQDIVDRTADVVRSAGIMLTMVPHLEEGYRAFWAQATAEELDRVSEVIKIYLSELEYYLRDPRYSTLLLTVGDFRGIMKESQQALADGKRYLVTLSGKGKK